MEWKRTVFGAFEGVWPANTDVLNAVSMLREQHNSIAKKRAMEQVIRWNGVIESVAASPIRIKTRFLPRWPSLLEVYLDQRLRRLPDDCCRIYYNHPRSCPGFTVLAYACSGRRTSLATLRAGLTILEEIAILAANQAIVCQSTNPRLDKRILKHFGYVQHVPHLKGKHYIKRLASRF